MIKEFKGDLTKACHDDKVQDRLRKLLNCFYAEDVLITSIVFYAEGKQIVQVDCELEKEIETYD